MSTFQSFMVLLILFTLSIAHASINMHSCYFKHSTFILFPTFVWCMQSLIPVLIWYKCVHFTVYSRHFTPEVSPLESTMAKWKSPLGCHHLGEKLVALNYDCGGFLLNKELERLILVLWLVLGCCRQQV